MLRGPLGQALLTGLLVAPEVLDVGSVERIGSDTYEVGFRSLPAMTGVTRVLDDVVVSLATLCRRPTRLRPTDERTTGAAGRSWGLVVGQLAEALYGAGSRELEWS